MPSLVRYLLLVGLIVPFVASVRIAADARSAQPASDPASAATYFSELEASRQYAVIYAYMHPDAQAIIPQAAVVGWYANEFGPLGPGVITVTGVAFVSWTWPVTGKTYPITAEVSFRQPFANGSVADEVVRLVEHQGEWRWFFGRSRAFVDEQIARYGSNEHQSASQDSGQSTALGSCDGDAAWWAETFPRSFLIAYFAGTSDWNQLLRSGDQYLLDYAGAFRRAYDEQAASIPPAAGQYLQDDLLAIYDGFALALEYLAADTGGLNPLADQGNLGAADRAFTFAGNRLLTLEFDTFLKACHPVVVFVPALGGDNPPAPVLPGEPEPIGYFPVECRWFATVPDAQRFFEASGPGDLYGLDPDGDGRACEPGE